jgi:hypothetical protein
VSTHDSDTVGLDSTTDSVDVMPTAVVGDVLSHRYRLDEEIGRGGMGIVFRGWDTDLERQVAVKVLGLEHQVGDAKARLFREARAAAALSHPHVVAARRRRLRRRRAQAHALPRHGAGRGPEPERA